MRYITIMSGSIYRPGLLVGHRAGQCDVTVLRDALATSELVLHKRSVRCSVALPSIGNVLFSDLVVERVFSPFP